MPYKSGPKFKCIKCLKLLLSEVVAADTRSLTDFISSLHVSFRIPSRLRKVKCHHLENIPSSRHSPIHARHIIFILYQRYVLLASVDFYLTTFKTTNFVKAMEILRELRHRKIFFMSTASFRCLRYMFFPLTKFPFLHHFRHQLILLILILIPVTLLINFAECSRVSVKSNFI